MSDDTMMTWWHPTKGCIQGFEEGGDETWIRVRLAGDHQLHRHGPADGRIDPDGKILLIRRSRMHTTPLPPIQEGGRATYQGVVHKVSSPPAPATPQSAMIPWEGRAVCGRWLTCHTATTVMVTCPACLAQPAIRRQALAEMVDCALEACLYEATSGSARGIR